MWLTLLDKKQRVDTSSTAERFCAEKAMQLGLVDEVVPHEELTDEVNKMVTTVLANGPHAIRQAKQLALDVAFKI